MQLIQNQWRPQNCSKGGQITMVTVNRPIVFTIYSISQLLLAKVKFINRPITLPISGVLMRKYWLKVRICSVKNRFAFPGGKFPLLPQCMGVHVQNIENVLLLIAFCTAYSCKFYIQNILNLIYNKIHVRLKRKIAYDNRVQLVYYYNYL